MPRSFGGAFGPTYLHRHLRVRGSVKGVAATHQPIEMGGLRLLQVLPAGRLFAPSPDDSLADGIEPSSKPRNHPLREKCCKLALVRCCPLRRTNSPTALVGRNVGWNAPRLASPLARASPRVAVGEIDRRAPRSRDPAVIAGVFSTQRRECTSFEAELTCAVLGAFEVVK